MKIPVCLKLCFAFGLVVGARLAADERPNILLVLTDDHSVPHVGCYGNPEIRTPNLDAMAREGLVFDRAYSASSQCVPARAALMTGRSPVAVDMTRFSASLDRSFLTYPEKLGAAGYFTGVAGRSFHLDGSYRQPPEVAEQFEKHALRTFEDRLDFVHSSSPRETMNGLREFLSTCPKEKPFFLQLSFHDPHRPFDDDAIPTPHDPAKLTLPIHYPDTPTARKDMAQHYDEIARFDRQFGEVREELAKHGRTENTLIVFMGDNGAALLRGKGTLYEFGIHVPLIFYWPGHIAPGRTEQLVSGEDIGPTLLTVAGLPVPAEMTGRDFSGLWDREAVKTMRPRDYVFAERGSHGTNLPVDTAAFDLSRVVVSRTHKLIYRAMWQMPYVPIDFDHEPIWQELLTLNRAGKLSQELARIYFPPARPMFELYDLEKDPGEMNDLFGKAEAEAVQTELIKTLTEWMILERDYMPLPVGI